MKVTEKNFIRKHKGEIIIGTILIVVTGVIIYKKWDVAKGLKAVKSVLGSAKLHTENASAVLKTTETPVVERNLGIRTIDINQFVRNLPDSWKASPKKLEQAKKLGIQLAEHQTLVNPHIRRIA